MNDTLIMSLPHENDKIPENVTRVTEQSLPFFCDSLTLGPGYRGSFIS